MDLGNFTLQMIWLVTRYIAGDVSVIYKFTEDALRQKSIY